MPLFHALILALVQAATEFLPVSSTAHLILTPWLLGWQDHRLLFVAESQLVVAYVLESQPALALCSRRRE